MRALRVKLLAPLAAVFLLAGGCGRETKNTPTPKLGQQGLEQKSGKAGGRSWLVDSENYLVIEGRRRVVLGMSASNQKDGLPREINARLLSMEVSTSLNLTGKDAAKNDPLHLLLPPDTLLAEENPRALPLWLVLRWDLSNTAGKTTAPTQTWKVTWGGLPQNLPAFEGNARFKLYNVDDGKVNDLSTDLAPARVTPLPEAEGPGFEVALTLRQRNFPAASRLEGVALLAFSASERLLGDAERFATLKGPAQGKPLFGPETRAVEALLFGPVAHSPRVFEGTQDGMFYPDLTRDNTLLEHYRKWLISRYGSVETLNDYTEGGHKSFQSVAWRVNTLPEPGPTGKPQTYKEWENMTEAERTLRVQSDFLRELRARNTNRALLWLKEKHPQTPVLALITGDSDKGFVEKATVAGDGVVFWLSGPQDLRRNHTAASATEDAKSRSGSTKFLAAMLSPQATAALTVKLAQALGENGFRGLYLAPTKEGKILKTLTAYEDAVKTTTVAVAIQQQTPESNSKKGMDSVKAREKNEKTAPLGPPTASGSAPTPPGATPVTTPGAPPLRPMDSAAPGPRPPQAGAPKPPLTPSAKPPAPSTVPTPTPPVAPKPPTAPGPVSPTPPSASSPQPTPAPSRDTAEKEEEFGL